MKLILNENFGRRSQFSKYQVKLNFVTVYLKRSEVNIELNKQGVSFIYEKGKAPKEIKAFRNILTYSKFYRLIHFTSFLCLRKTRTFYIFSCIKQEIQIFFNFLQRMILYKISYVIASLQFIENTSNGIMKEIYMWIFKIWFRYVFFWFLLYNKRIFYIKRCIDFSLETYRNMCFYLSDFCFVFLNIQT